MTHTIKQVTALDNSKLYTLGKFDKANRWYPCEEIAPSRAWPHSYWRAAKTLKFARWYAAQQEQQACK